MDQHSFFIRYKLHHLAFWIVVFFSWFYLRHQEYRNSTMALAVTFVKVADLMVMIYFVNYWLIPKVLYKKRYIDFSVVFIVMALVSGICKVYMLRVITGNASTYSFNTGLKTKLYENVISDFFLVLAGAAVRMIVDYLAMQQRLAEVAKEKAVTELNFLKSQINPHFLFNSLNAVYFLIHKENSEARDALHKFSDMLRYQLYEASVDKIPLEKEVRYLKDYSDLQMLRKDDTVQISFKVPDQLYSYRIEPLLLIPFLENAFKHISHHQSEPNTVSVELDVKDDILYYSVQNTKEQISGSTEKPGGIGLNNVKRRLELLYPGKYELVATDQGDKYLIYLKLDIS